MKPEIILQTDLLDILFYNRNKAYGAYILRSEYNSRLKRSITVTFTIALLFSISWYLQVIFFQEPKSMVAGQSGPDIYLKNVEPKKNIQLINKRNISAKNQIRKMINPVYRIVPDDSLKKIALDIKSDENTRDGIVNNDGIVDNGVGSASYEGTDTMGIDTLTKAAITEPEEPLNIAEFMPEFPGGIEGLNRFMLRNLREPDDLDEGEKVVIQTRFVVEANGQVDNIEILSATSRYDGDVLKVISKMPLWKSGIQNGIHVPVYFTLPVTFQRD